MHCTSASLSVPRSVMLVAAVCALSILGCGAGIDGDAAEARRDSEDDKTSPSYLVEGLSEQSARKGELRLRLEGLEASGPVSGARLFLNNERADENTSIQDESYIGSIAFFPLPPSNSDSLSPVGTHVVTLSKELAEKGMSDDKEMVLTLVPIVEEPGAKASISVNDVEVISRDDPVP